MTSRLLSKVVILLEHFHQNKLTHNFLEFHDGNHYWKNIYFQLKIRVSNDIDIIFFYIFCQFFTMYNLCGFLSRAGRKLPPKIRFFYTYSNEPTMVIPKKEPIVIENPEEAFECLKSNNCVYVQAAAATPNALLNAMTEVGKRKKLENITVCHMHTEGPACYAQPGMEKIFRSTSFFIGANVRKAVADGRADSIPLFLQEIPLIFYKKILKPDFALISLSPPDKHGFCSLGTSIDCARAALQNAKIIVAQVNCKMPRTFGDGAIHISHLDYAYVVTEELPVLKERPLTEAEKKIGEFISEKLVENGATLQMGIGSIPDAVLEKLHNHKDLGIHSEMFAGGVVDLALKGVITNSQKPIHQGRIVGSFLIGPKKLYDFVDNNPIVEMLKVDYVNDTKVIRKNPKMTAINACIEVDLTGQVVADSIGPRMYSGFGGQVDFIRGAAEGFDGRGKPILALSSRTTKNKPKIVPFITQGAGVVTTRAHVNYVVTEYGIAELFGKNLRQRAHALINIAHPEDRASLEKAAFERLKIKPSP